MLGWLFGFTNFNLVESTKANTTYDFMLALLIQVYLKISFIRAFKLVECPLLEKYLDLFFLIIKISFKSSFNFIPFFQSDPSLLHILYRSDPFSQASAIFISALIGNG